MIQNDGVSNALGLLGIFLSFYLATIQLSFLSIFPILMITASYALQHRFNVSPRDPSLDSREKSNIALYALLGLAGAFLANYATNYVITAYTTVRALSIMSLSITNMELIFYGASIAIAEEEFFRGFLLNYIAKNHPVPVAFIASSAVFASFHLAVYGTQPELLVYVFVSAIILSYVSWKTKHVTTGILCHMAVNILSYSMAGAVVG